MAPLMSDTIPPAPATIAAPAQVAHGRRRDVRAVAVVFVLTKMKLQ